MGVDKTLRILRSLNWHSWISEKSIHQTSSRKSSFPFFLRATTRTSRFSALYQHQVVFPLPENGTESCLVVFKTCRVDLTGKPYLQA